MEPTRTTHMVLPTVLAQELDRRRSNQQVLEAGLAGIERIIERRTPWEHSELIVAVAEAARISPRQANLAIWRALADRLIYMTPQEGLLAKTGQHADR